MPDPLRKIIDSIWLKLICVLFTGLFTLVSGYGIYHLNKLDSIVHEMQEDKVELIDRINTIDEIRENDIKEVKDLMNTINITLQKFIAKTESNRFTSEDGLQVWQEITRLKQNVVDLQRQIDRAHDNK